ncbi:conserved oligomeric Golgi complex subunit 2-like [Lingula anatina]|uniref:Conserved oligomeric Golgi complex subunit 2-like n=1 Tax=Lingula anatina TaxID=7574 RepID=A0A1S3IGJ9_LINAN|nr:conserved oligomeric Golgi complex subunit 2-like [Lingula anatina]|eukprot:XP_013396594.1 conserved oligomeric Golgi complex subunit 2-like [Lingula anatina]
MDEAISTVEEKLKKRAECRDKKACVQRLMNIIHCVEKMEKLLGIPPEADEEQIKQSASELNGQLIERVATEFNKLQFYVNKSKGLPLLEQIRPRISAITTTLQFSLEGSFREGLERKNPEILRQCLRTYATIDKMKDAEQLFRQYTVKPYMEEVISDQFIKTNTQGLRGMYHKILEFIPLHCKLIKEVTSGSLKSTSGEVVRGYDFLTNAVWPEIVSNVEGNIPFIFAPGNPDLFHERYNISMEFVDQFECQCGSQASVKRLRAHPSFNTFMSKWSLPVYFQIRFQEVAGSFENALLTPFNVTADSKEFHLHSTTVLWSCLCKCWSDDVFLSGLCHRFWKLTLQLLARYSNWIEAVHAKELTEKDGNSADPGVSNPGTGSGDPPALAPRPAPVTLGQVVAMVADAHRVDSKVTAFFTEVIKPKLKTTGCQDSAILEESLQESQTSITKHLPGFGEYIVKDITAQCSVHLKLVNDIPRLYRRTNREVPSKTSGYLNSLLKPLKMFLDEHKTTISEEMYRSWVMKIICEITEQYHSIVTDVLTSVKKMEDSLKRLKRSKTTPNFGSNQGPSDDDKIRLQIALDVDEFGKQIENLGICKDAIEAYKKLHDLVESAQNAASSSQSEK